LRESDSHERVPMKRISVFCGSSPGARPEYVLAARQLAKALVSRSIGLVCGCASVGLMGKLARTVEALGEEVVGSFQNLSWIKRWRIVN
jgi:predicted Rossmann-fold nucleotide-binding protein